MIVALILALSRPDPDAVALEGIMKARMPMTFAPAALKAALWPAIRGKYPDAYWEVCAPTAGQPGAYFEVRLRTKNMERQGAVGVVVAREGTKLRGHVVQVVQDMTVDATKGFVYANQVFVDGTRVLWCGSAESSANWTVPAVIAIARTGSNWHLASRTVEPQMAGYPGAEFAKGPRGIDPNRILITTRRYPVNIQQPHVGPLLQYRATWQIHGTQVTKSKSQRVSTALASLDDLAGYVRAGRHEPFDAVVPPESRQQVWNLLKHEVHVDTGSNEQSDTATDLFTVAIKDGDPTIGLHFTPGRRGWHLAQVTVDRSSR